MARRRRTGAAEDIIDLTALLPWWAGVALACIRQYLLPLLCLIGAVADGENSWCSTSTGRPTRWA